MDHRLGLQLLKSKLEEAGGDSELMAIFHVLESRLLENLADEMQHGSSENVRHDRSRIVDELNRLARSKLDVSFNDLCPEQTVTAAILTAPPLPAYHVERTAAVESVHSLLTEPEAKPAAPVGILGMSGVGKTVLATALVHSQQTLETFRDGILWATLGPQARSAEDAKPYLLGWGSNLGLELNPTLRVETLVSMLTNALSRRRCLLVLDDVWSVLPATALLNLRGSRCGAILTTRDTGLIAALGAAPIRLDVPTPSEAKLMVERRLSREIVETETAEVDELLARLGYLPLAVSLAAAQAWLGMPWHEMLDALRQAQPALEALDFANPEVREQSLRLSFDLTYSHLDQESQWRYRALGVLATDAPFLVGDVVPLWFYAVTDLEQRVFELAKRWSETQREAAKCLRNFANLGILQRIEAQPVEIYQQHPLLRLDALRRLKPAEQTLLLEAHASWFKSLLDNFTETQRWDVLERAGPQLYAVMHRLQRGYSCEPGLSVFSGDEARHALVDVVMQLSVVWIQRRHSADLIKWVGEALKCTRVLGRRDMESAQLGNLGAAYLAINDIEQATRLFRQSLAIDQELARKPGQVVNLVNLGAAMAKQGNYVEAIKMVHQARALAHEIGSVKRETECLAALGSYHMQENPQKARQLLEQALDLARIENLRMLVRNVLFNLGELALRLGDFESAIVHLVEALEMSQEFADVIHVAEIAAMVGEALVGLHQENEAIKYLAYSLKVSRQVDDHKTQGRSLTGLAKAYLNQGQTKQAAQFCNQAIELDRRMGWLRDELVDLKILMGIQEEKRQHRRVLQTLEASLSIAEQLGDSHEQGLILSLLAVKHLTMGQDRAHQAIEYAKQALSIHEKLGEVHATVRDLLLLGQATMIPGKSTAPVLIYSWRALIRAEQAHDRKNQLEACLQIAKVYQLTEFFLQEWQFLAKAKELADKIKDTEAQRSVKSRINALRRETGEIGLSVQGTLFEDSLHVRSYTTAQVAAWVVEVFKGNLELRQKAYDQALSFQQKPGSTEQPFPGIFIGHESDADFPYYESLGRAFQRILEGLQSENVLAGLSGRARDIAEAILEQVQ